MMTEPVIIDPKLAAVVRWAEGRPAFLASRFAAVKAQHQATDADLAAHLRTSVEWLPWLALCRLWLPEQRDGEWGNYIAGLAQYSHARYDQLKALIAGDIR